METLGFCKHSAQGSANGLFEHDTSCEHTPASLQTHAALGQVAEVIAHELDCPLRTVAGHVNELLGQFSTRSERWRIEAIGRAIERCQSIVGHTRGLAGEGSVPSDSVDLNELVRALVDMKAHSRASRSFVLSTDFEKNLPPVRADFGRLLLVALNLLANAERAVYSAAGVGEVNIFTRTVGGSVQLGVSDTGPGIPYEIQDRVFEPNFSRSTTEGNTGIELWMSRTIVKQHGGTIHLDSVPEDGTTFTVELPAASEKNQ